MVSKGETGNGRTDRRRERKEQREKGGATEEKRNHYRAASKHDRCVRETFLLRKAPSIRLSPSLLHLTIFDF